MLKEGRDFMISYVKNTDKAIKLLSQCNNFEGVIYRIVGQDENGVKVSIPCVTLGPGFYDTVEGCTLSHCEREIRDIAQKAFYTLPPEVRYSLAFLPKDGEFIARSHLWKSLLSSVMSPVQCRKAMIRIIHWYIHIKKMKDGRNSI